MIDQSVCLVLINLCACAAIVAVGLFGAVNRMGPGTNHRFRVVWILLTTGAFASLLAPIFGHAHPEFSEVIMKVGIALWVTSDRRKDGTPT